MTRVIGDCVNLQRLETLIPTPHPSHLHPPTNRGNC